MARGRNRWPQLHIVPPALSGSPTAIVQAARWTPVHGPGSRSSARSRLRSRHRDTDDPPPGPASNWPRPADAEGETVRAVRAGKRRTSLLYVREVRLHLGTSADRWIHPAIYRRNQSHDQGEAYGGRPARQE